MIPEHLEITLILIVCICLAAGVGVVIGQFIAPRREVELRDDRDELCQHLSDIRLAMGDSAARFSELATMAALHRYSIAVHRGQCDELRRYLNEIREHLGADDLADAELPMQVRAVVGGLSDLRQIRDELQARLDAAEADGFELSGLTLTTTN